MRTSGARTEDSPRYDRFVEFERFTEAVRRLGDDAEVVDLVLGEVGDAERRHVRRADPDLRPVTAARLALLDDVSLDRIPTVVERRRPVYR